ncbi:AlkA N-terminal domain-containing protein [Salinicola rhizosphaerae]|uniref:DNA-3-methyladenine glycosylase II n=1 Tax=Salinicola rhizosphaerae TaxID=1443141 RepID=A0ABQ3DPY7_9GAMM|nr:AlkA N-terminal domain-containing protein [Salinicola rhizosphaerae]GHB09961.1 3-methyladenine DNA glycosylase [Salinicola rhizosphaerae]
MTQRLHDDSLTLTAAQCQQARLSRDPRFDGRFFIGVTTTGIYCRPICPAVLPRESHVHYYGSAVAAASAGYRPCLRCRPDSAPESPAWRGSQTTFTRALQLIDQGALQHQKLPELCDRLGVGERYLRQLFQRRFGVSPKRYALYRQCLFAKQLLHQSTLPVTDVALASGFSSLRRFNDAFKRHIGLTPSEIRRQRAPKPGPLTLRLAYRPPYEWSRLRHFFALHLTHGIEWIGDDHYGRTIRWGETTGSFTACHDARHHRFDVSLALDRLDQLNAIVRQIRQLLDLDADTTIIETHLGNAYPGLALTPGLRLPGSWGIFEAGIRAVLGQQVSIAAANRLTQRLVDTLGERDAQGRVRFPTPAAIAGSDLAFLGMPASRRDTLGRLANAYVTGEIGDDPASWTQLKGIGPWTADVAAFRGAGHPDIWLASDLGIKRALKRLDHAALNEDTSAERASPWRSYLTLQLWNHIL